MKRDVWSPEERSARMLFRFDDGSFYQQRTISLHLDPGDEKSPTFPLYYFVKDQTYDNKEKPTILFAAGGPGQMILPDTENFADMYGYRLVYFHLRGTGFSQLPEGFSADKYIRTSYVVKDIEKIRKDLLGVEPWTAVMGHSYGAVVVQRYAYLYGDKVKKVILSAPMAPMSSIRARNGNTNDAQGETQAFESLKKIYKRNDFGFLDGDSVRKAVGSDVRTYLDDQIRKIVRIVEYQYWSVQSVGDRYNDLIKDLKNQGLDYGAAFFGAVRRLRTVGWLPLDIPYAKPISTPKIDDSQVQCGLVIARAILRKERKFELESVFKDGDILKDKLADGERLLSRGSTQNSARPYYLISILDGLNDKILTSLQSGRGIRAFRPKGDLAKVIARLKLAKPPKPWNPKDSKHNKPTLILKGGADPVTEQGQAEYYFDNALLSKEKILVEFPGVGHSMALPDLDPSDAALLKIPVKTKGEPKEVRTLSPRDQLIDEFLMADSVAGLKKADFVQALSRAFKKSFDQLEKGVADENESRDLIVKTGY